MQIPIENVENHRNDHGMHWMIATVFIVGDMLGAGLIALPVAIENTGLTMGVILIFLTAVFSCITATHLAESWIIMQVQWPEYQQHCRRPYPEIAYRALGPTARLFVSLFVCITQFGLVTVVSLLAAKNISNFLLATFDIHLSFCIILLLLSFILAPFCMLRSPKDFWLAAFFAAGSSITAGCILIWGSFRDSPTCSPVVDHNDFNINKLFLGYGTIVFAYGGHCVFPSIQHDMRKPYNFTRSLKISFVFIVIIYLAVSIMGYITYGNSMRDTMIPSLQTTWMSQTANMLITLHILPTITIIFSPLAQQVEEWTNTPHDFSLQRLFVRFGLLICVLLTALSIPDFGVFMDLVGATTLSLMCMVLPSIFYLYLKAYQNKLQTAQRDGSNDKSPRATYKDVWKFTSTTELILVAITLAFGTIGGIAGTIAAVSTFLTSNELAVPCYVAWWNHGVGYNDMQSGAINCCGAFKNVSIHGHETAGFCSLY